MNQLFKKILAGACGVLLATATLADVQYDWTTKGSFAVGRSGTYTLPEDGELYLKLSGVKPPNSSTFVVTGEGAMIEVVYTYSEDGDVWDSTLASSTPDVKTENQDRCIITYEDWTDNYIVIVDSEDKEWKVTPKGYYLHISGEGDSTVTVTSMSGAVEESIPVGDVDNPKTLVPAALPTLYKANFVEGEYYINAAVKTGYKYLFATSGGTAEQPLYLDITNTTGTVTLTDVSSEVANEGNVAYLVEASQAGTLSIVVTGEQTSFALSHQYATSGGLCKLTVNTKGTTNCTWQIKGVSTKNASGDTLAILGSQTVVFNAAKGFTTPANVVVQSDEGVSSQTIVGVYKDTFDPKDDVVTGATKITPAAKSASAARTLFAEDTADYFAFTAKDGVFYNFALTDLTGDASFTVATKADPETALVESTTNLTKYQPGKGDFIVKVAHTNALAAADAQYSLTYTSANVGTVAFASVKASAKKSTGTIALKVNRTSAEGKIRVKYGTVCGTALPGVDYVAQSGELVWENGDKTARTITIKLIPELHAEAALSRTFTVQLKALEEDEIADDEYPAAFTAGKDVATITVTETKGKTTTAVKAATVKTESVPLETGTFQGVIAEDGSALTNGFPALASVTFTAKNAAKNALSAKVLLGGKTYTFAANTWDESLADEGTVGAALTQIQKVGKVAYTNTLTITVAAGLTATADAWKTAGADVELVMNVPDAKGNGVQENIVYTGSLVRDNAKIQDFLTAVTNAVGYYTVALNPFGVTAADGIPAGNGYLTLTLDNKGKAKVAGMLADGTTKPSYTSIVAVQDDGDTLLVPVYVAKSPYCFGGMLKLVKNADGVYVVDSTESLIWNNDNVLLTYAGEEGWRISLSPIGGYFNTLNNLQAAYLTSTFSVETVDVSELPTEALATDYSYVTEGTAVNGFDVSLAGDVFSTTKKSLVKTDGVYDFTASANPCNVQVKLARATGIVTGSFSAWSETSEGKQKEITGLKHYGILLLTRDVSAPLADDVLTAGFFTQTATLSYEVTTGTKTTTKTRKWTASLPFNILATDQGEPDWYAEDWGEQPE